MKFWYTPVTTRTPDTNEEKTLLRPVIPLLVYGENDATLCSVLVDTGADNSFLPRSVADALKIPLASGEGPSPIAFGGGKVETFFSDVVLHITDGEDDCAWTARVLVFDSEDAGDELVVLGHQGFLEYFRVSFDGEAGTLELEPLESLPAVEE
jgi:predicted aspartyl protease